MAAGVAHSCMRSSVSSWKWREKDRCAARGAVGLQGAC
jgi:hypothetical protein